MRTRPTLPDAARNPVSLIGMGLATAMAVLFLVLFLLEVLGYLTGPYIGLLTFATIPVLFVLALLLIPLGSWLSARRRRRHPGAPEWPVLDLRHERTRAIAAIVFALTVVNIVIVSLAAYGGVHYMESTEFCGQACHTTMEPQAVAHRSWPHAEVACTQCHVGPGAGAFVEAKLAGTRQLWHVMTGQVPRPVPSPDRLIQPASTACQQCHSGAARADDELRVIREYGNDEANTETATTLRMRVGGAETTGIHRHNGMTIDYAASGPSRETIPYVRVQDARGVREYVAEGTPIEQARQGPLRRMECIDCHNRPAHTFAYTPQRAIDDHIASGRIPRELPFVRREAVAAVEAEYADREAALNGIARRLTDFYASRNGDRRLVDRAIAGAQAVWSANVFPAMQVKWGTYPNQIGHIDTPGCFRCHDDSHTTADGRTISQDCELCHTMPE